MVIPVTGINISAKQTRVGYTYVTGREDRPAWEVGQPREHESIVPSISGAHVCSAGTGHPAPPCWFTRRFREERAQPSQLARAAISALLPGEAAERFPRAPEWHGSAATACASSHCGDRRQRPPLLASHTPHQRWHTSTSSPGCRSGVR